MRREHGLIQLLDPPFDAAQLDPGYIIGYVPGVRENGGQYTHAAIWTIMAFAALGDHERAWELLDLINPVRHGASADGIATYKVEPYVAVADIYARPPHTGRGGWSWYTGSAGWFYRLIVESLLGLRREGDRLRLAPCVPAHWKGFGMTYRFGATTYVIAVRQTAAADTSPAPVAAATRMSVRVDGVEAHDGNIPLIDDGAEHLVSVVIADGAEEDEDVIDGTT